jgi:carbamoyltransferase
MKVLSFHFNEHDFTICCFINGKYKIIEVERLTGLRYYGLKGMMWDKNCPKSLIYKNFMELVDILKMESVYEIEYDACVYNMINPEYEKYIKIFINAKKYERKLHHESHAACAFYQSNFEKSLVLSYDGGGDDGITNIYLFEKNNYKLVKRHSNNYVTLYTYLTNYIYDIAKIEKIDHFHVSLSHAGKMMGFSGYGTISDKMKSCISEVFDMQVDWHDQIKTVNKIQEKLSECGVHGPIKNFQDAITFSATVQHCFENKFLTLFKPYIDEYKNLPICLTGGGALNINLNTKIKEYINERNIFVPPNPNDSGVSLGSLFLEIKPQSLDNITYNGVTFSGYEELFNLSKINNMGKNFTSFEIANLLKSGKIIATMRYGSEIGPRALGNRSILCNPSFGSMKDILNKKIKFREWFRPFAPVVQEQYANIYFDMIVEKSPYMSFNVKVRDEWKEQLSAITHVDGSARVQTVTEYENPWLYDILKEFGKINNHSVLLNTSFNSKGKPLCNTITEAFHILKETPIDYLIINDLLFDKESLK